MKILTAEPFDGEELQFKATFAIFELTKEVPDLNWFNENTVVAIKGKYHWAAIENTGDIRIIRNDGWQVEYINCTPRYGIKDFRTFFSYGKVYTADSGTFVDHAWCFLDRRDEEAKYFFELGSKNVK